MTSAVLTNPCGVSRSALSNADDQSFRYWWACTAALAVFWCNKVGYRTTV